MNLSYTAAQTTQRTSSHHYENNEDWASLESVTQKYSSEINRCSRNLSGQLANRRVFLVVLIFSTCLSNLFSQDVSHFSHFKDIVIHSSQVAGSGTHSDFAFLFDATHDDFRSTAEGGFMQEPNGYDIWFTLPDGSTALDYEMESYDPVAGRLVVWVEIDIDATVDTYLRIYFGSSISNTDRSSVSTWNTGYRGVYHVETDATFVDATPNTNAMDGGGAPGPGQIAGSAGQNTYTPVSSGPGAFAITGNLTLEAWVNIASYVNTGKHTILHHGPAASATGGQNNSLFNLAIDLDTGLLEFSWMNGNNNLNTVVSTAPVSLSGWHQITATRVWSPGNSSITFYLDGMQLGDPVAFLANASGGGQSRLHIGHNPSEASASAWGNIDEIRISDDVRSPEWIQTGYNTSSDPENFFSLVDPSCDATFSYSQNDFCRDDPVEDATISGDSGGTFASPDGNITFLDASTGRIDFNASSLGGPYDVIYKISETCADTVEITINANPSTAVAGMDQQVCSTTAQLAATQPAVGTGRWSVVSGQLSGFSFDNDEVYNTNFYGTVGEDYDLQWEVSTTCGSSSDVVYVDFYTGNFADAGPDQWSILCGTTSTNLAATGLTSGVGEWTVISGQPPSDWNLDDSGAHNSQFDGMKGETYELQWKVDNSICTSLDTVEIRFPNDPATIDAGPDQIICDGSSSAILTGISLTSGETTWTIISGGAGSFTDDGSLMTTFNGNVGNKYELELTNLEDSCTTTDRVIIAFDPSDAVNAGVDQSICGDSTSLTGNVIAGLSPMWLVTEGTGSIDDPSATTINVTGLSSGTNTFEYTLGCSRDYVKVFVDSIPPVLIVPAPSTFNRIGNCEVDKRIQESDPRTISYDGALQIYTSTTAINLIDAVGQQIIWNYDVYSPEDYDIKIRYTRDATMNSTIDLIINGAPQTLTLPQTLSGEFANIAVTESLPASTNSIVLETNAAGMSADIDWIEITLDGSPDDEVSYADAGGPIHTDDCFASSDFYDITASSCEGQQSIKRVWTVRDTIGNETVDTQYIEIVDQMRPQFSVPNDTVLYTPVTGCGVDIAPSSTGQPTDIRDNCSSSPLVIHSDTDNGTSCFGTPDTIYREWTITDDCGNFRRRTQVIVIKDTIQPTFILPPNDTLYKPPTDCTFTLPTTTPTSIVDNCMVASSPPTSNDVYQPSTCSGSVDLFRIWTALDNCGNVKVDTQYIAIRDTVAPLFTSIPNDTIIYYDDACNLPNTLDEIRDNLIALWVIDDNCDPSPSLVHNLINTSISCSGTEIHTVRWTTTDDCGNARFEDQLITLSDTIAPTFTRPSDIIIYVNAACFVDTDTSLAVGTVRDESDGCSTGLDATYSDNIVSGCNVGSYTIERNWTLADPCGNSRSEIQVIEVQDTTPPNFNPPANTILYLDAACNVDSDPSNTGYIPWTTENCSSIRDTSYSDVVTAGSCGPEFTITRTWTLTDSCGFSAQRVQIITVEDTIAPTFDLPVDITIYTLDDCSINDLPSITGSPTNLADNCTGSTLTPIFLDSSTSSTCPGERIITRTWYLADVCGNTRSKQQTITVRDTTPPDFTVPRDTIFYRNIDCDAILTTIAETGDVIDESDNCSVGIQATFADSQTSPCGNDVEIIRRWTLRDDCNNVTEQIQTIRILDTITPTFTVPRDTMLYVDGNCVADTSFVGTLDVDDEWDNCSTGLEAVYRDSVVTTGCDGSYVVYRLWHLIDECANINRQTQIITVMDNVPPIFITPQNDTLYLDVNCFADTTLTGLGNIITIEDNCDAALDTSYSDIVTPICEGSYRLRRTWTLTDDCNNSTSRDQWIVVLDTIRPTFTVPNDTTIYLTSCAVDDSPANTGDVTDEMDNCSTSIDAVHSDVVVNGCGSERVITRTWLLEDACGNEISKSQTITFRDTLSPTFTAPPTVDIYVDDNCNVDLSAAGDVTDEGDNCVGFSQATFVDAAQPAHCVGSYQIIRTWSMTDACSNSVSHNQIINVIDTIAPTFTAPSDLTLYMDIDCEVDTALGSTGDITLIDDNCDTAPNVSFSQTITNAICAGHFDIARTWTLVDDCGNSRSRTQIIAVRDSTPPALSVPADQIVYLGGGSVCNTIESIGFESGYQSWIQGGQNCDLSTQFPNSGSSSVRLQNNSSTSVITSPTLDLSSYDQANIDFSYYVEHMNAGETFEVQLSTNNGASFIVLKTYIEGIDFSDGNRYDGSLNIPSSLLSANNRVRFRLFGDTNAERIYIDDIAINSCILPGNCAVDTTSLTLGIATSSGDNCSGAATPTYTDIIDASCGNTYIARREWSISDDCGNVTTATQVIEVRDTIPPVLSLPLDRVYYLDNTCTTIDTTPVATGIATIVGDNCSNVPQLSYVDSYADDCGSAMTISREWSLTDDCGNTTTETQTILLLDTISPILFGIPADTHFQCATPDDPPVIGVGITATDNCDPDVNITFSQVSTRTFDNSCTDVIYTITRTWTATDTCGNSTVRVQNITASCECCNNGIDDDGDGAIDESDNDCPCTTSEVSLNCDPSYYYFVPSIWRMTGGNYDDPSKLTITTPGGTANYTIRTADGSYSQNRTVTQGTADVINLTTAHILTTGANQVEDDKGFIIESDQALQVLYQLDAHYNKLLITYKGEQGLGQRFRVASQTNICGNNPAASDENHFISVMAAEDDTEVTFEFDMPLYNITSPHSVMLDAGETYLVRDAAWANQTVTGALVTASRPVAVVSGSQHTMNCNNSGGNAPGRDGGADQLVPTCLVGQDYVAVRGSGQDYSNYVIVVGITASTGIYINGSAIPIATVGPGEYFEYQLSGNFGDAHYIRTDKPAYAYQVGNLSTNNEPGMAIMSPVGDCRGESNIEFVEFPGSENGVNVLVPTSALSSLELNGAGYATYSGITTTAIPGYPIYTSVSIPDAHVSSYNNLAADEPFIASQYVGVSGASGTYGYLTSFKDEVIITNPSTGTSDFQYSLDTLCGGIVFNHCVDATSCAGGQYITDVIPGPHTTNVSFDPTGGNTCFSYTGEAGYDGFDEITVYIADAYGLITAICVDIYLCGSTPFVETIPADTLILCNEVIPAPPVYIPIDAGCSQSYDLTYAADSTVTYNQTCSDYAFTITRSWTLTDNCGNDTTVYQLITIADTINPVLVSPPDTILYADGICALDTLISQIGEAEDIADNCDPQMDAVYQDSLEVNPSCAGTFLIYRKWMAIDDCGNIYSSTQIIDIRDTISPTFTPPADTFVYVDDMCNAETDPLYLGQPISPSDNCSVGLVSTHSDNVLSGCSGSAIIVRTWRITDDCGNYSEETQTIAVYDTTGPQIATPSDTILYYNASCSVDTSMINLGGIADAPDNCNMTIAPTYRDSTETSCDRNYTTHRIWEAIDDCGNMTRVIQTIVVLDTIQPTMSIPRDTTLYKDVLCEIDTTTRTTGTAINVTDNCTSNSIQATYSDSVVLDCEIGFTISRVWRLEDLCGNIRTEIQTITVVDSIKPAFTIPRDTIIYSDLSCFADTAAIDLGYASDLSDNCDATPTLSYHDDITRYCDGQFDIDRVWALTDDCGNVHRDTQFISVLDTIDPFFITPSNVTLYSDINCYVDTSWMNTGGARFENDNCDLSLIPTYRDSIGEGCGVGYEVFRKWEVTDDCGNMFAQTQVITILDRMAPTFTTPNDTTLYSSPTCFVDTTSSSTGTLTDLADNCAIIFAIYQDDIIALSCAGSYQIERTWSVEDECGNRTSDIQIITVLDSSAPTFTVPRDTLLYAKVSCQIDTTTVQIGDVVDEMDNCDATLDATYIDQLDPSSCDGSPIIRRIWRLEDDCNNVTVDTQFITVMDTIRPTFTVPSDTTIYGDISCVVDTTVTSTGDIIDEDDNCDTSLDATYSDAVVNGCAGSYVITRTWSLTDDCGNSISGDQIITVEDTIAPTFTTPGDITLYLSVGCVADTTIFGTGDVVDASDGCDTSINASYSDSVFTGCGSSYEITRTWTARDACGNTYSDTQTISVLDSVAPMFTTPSDITVYVDDACAVDTTIATLGTPSGVSDNCTGTIETSHTNTITSTCEGNYEITRRWTLTDECGNMRIDSQRIVVLDTIAPTFIPPSDSILYKGISCDADTTIAALGSPTLVADNCTTGTIAVDYEDQTVVSCQESYITTRTWTLIDACGNTSTHVQNIEVRDTSAPTFTVPGDTIIYANVSCAVDVTVSSSGDILDEDDNCDTSLDATFIDAPMAVCGGSYNIRRTWSLIDDCGNTTTGIQIISVVDTIAPDVTLPPDVTIYKTSSCSIDTTARALGYPSSVDNCGGSVTSIYDDEVQTNCEGSFEFRRIWLSTDQCGNVSIDTQLITVLDTIRPTLDIPGDITLSLTSLCEIDTSTLVTGVATNLMDNCSPLSELDLAYLDEVIDSCTGSFILERTWVVSDACGNTGIGIQTINVVDDQAPTFEVPSDTTIYLSNVCSADTLPVSLGTPENIIDGCDSTLISSYVDVVTGGCGGSYTISRTWTVRDDCMNSSSLVQTIVALDTSAPTFTIPRDTVIYKLADCMVSIDPSDTGDVLDERDNCDFRLEAVYSDDENANCEGTATIYRTWTLTDNCGNDTSAIQVITVLDTIMPSFSVPRDTTVYRDLNCNVDLDPNLVGDVIDETDNCSTVLDATYTDLVQDSCLGSRVVTRTWILNDNCGNSYTQDQIIEVLDTSAPMFTRPMDMTLYTSVSCQLDTMIANTGIPTNLSENCSSTNIDYNDNIAVTCSGSFVISREWLVEDICGNQSSQIQTITVLDTIAPTFTPPADTTLFANTSCIADTSILNTGSEVGNIQECMPDLSVEYTDNIITRCGGSYTLERTWEVNDPCGNARSGIQTITVLDTLAPTFTPPVDTTLYVDDFCFADTTISNTGTILDTLDNCNNAIAISYVDTITAVCAGSYTIERTWLVSDECDNTGSSIQLISVVDTIAPNFIAPIDLTVYLDELNFGDTTTIGTGDVSGLSDNCSNDFEVSYRDSIVDVEANQVVSETYRIWTISDRCGNSRTRLQTIVMADTIPPLFIDPITGDTISTSLTDPIVYLDPVTGDTITTSPTDSIAYLDPVTGDTILISPTDPNVYVDPVTGDTITTSLISPPILQVDCEYIPEPDTLNFWDINDVVSITMIETRINVPCVDRFTIIRTWTATDRVGNQSSVDQVILVTTCNSSVAANISDPEPCFGEFTGLISQFSHATHENQYYSQWYHRIDATSPWTLVPNGNQRNISFPSYPERSGEYKVVYSIDPNFMDDSECQFHSNILSLTVLGEENIADITAEICANETYTLGDSTFTETGNYNIVYENENGCDSIINLVLTVNDPIIHSIDTTICAGDYVELSDGTRHFTSDVYTDSLRSSLGCDSIVLISVVVQETLRDTIHEVICDGSFFEFHSDTLYLPGYYSDTLTASYGCDSIVVLDLQAKETKYHTLEIDICEGDTYYFDGLAFTADTQWERTFQGENGCDSIVTLDLSVNDVIEVIEYDTTCFQQAVTHGDTTLTQSTTIRDTFPSVFGCDSIHIFHLHVLEENITYLDIDLCAGDVFQFKNNSYSASDTLTDILPSITGCDSIVVYNLTIGTMKSSTEDHIVCSGDSVLLGTDYVDSEGSYPVLFTSSTGCEDSMVTYTVSLLEPVVLNQEVVICDGDSVYLDGAYRFAEGSYTSQLASNLTGCDSTMTTNLIVEEVIELWAEDVNVCFGESFDLVVDGADNLTWSSADLLSCNDCPNPSGYVEETTTFTATTEGCSDELVSIDIMVEVFEEVRLEVLTRDTTLTLGESIILDAFVTDPFSPITWYNLDGTVVCTNCNQPEVTPNQSGGYYAEANGNSSCVVRDSVIVTIKDGCEEGEVIIPNFISPNGDGFNDDLEIRYANIRAISKVRIFNRWGQLVFKSDNADNDRWDGTVNGSEVNPGVYVYFIDYECLNGENVFKKGNITLIK